MSGRNSSRTRNLLCENSILAILAKIISSRPRRSIISSFLPEESKIPVLHDNINGIIFIKTWSCGRAGTPDRIGVVKSVRVISSIGANRRDGTNMTSKFTRRSKSNWINRTRKARRTMKESCADSASLSWKRSTTISESFSRDSLQKRIGITPNLDRLLNKICNEVAVDFWCHRQPLELGFVIHLFCSPVARD